MKISTEFPNGRENPCVLARAHLGVADGDEHERQQVSKDEGAHHIDLPVVVGPDLPAVRVVVLSLHDALEVCHRGRHAQRQRPDQQHAQGRVPRHAYRGRLPCVNYGHVAVHGHRGQSEDADQHGHGEEVVDELTDEGAQDPGGQHVDGGLKGHAEQQVGQVRHAQVQDEDVGGAAGLSGFTAGEHRDHQSVPEDPQNEDEPENQQRNEVIQAHPEQGFVREQHRVALVLHLSQIKEKVHDEHESLPGREFDSLVILRCAQPAPFLRARTSQSRAHRCLQPVRRKSGLNTQPLIHSSSFTSF